MENNKFNNTIIFGMASFFYALIFYFCLEYVLKLFGVAMFDTPFMMACYSFPVLIFIYYFNDVSLNKFFKEHKPFMLVLPLIMLFIALCLHIIIVANDNKPIANVNEEQKFENAEPFLDLTEVNEDLNYKFLPEEKKVIKQGSDGVLRQFRAKEKDDMIDCTYTAYILDNGYILACKQDLSKNYYTNDSENYYQLNINHQDLRYLYRQDLAQFDANEVSDNKLEIAGNLYVTRLSYSKFTLYKHFKNDYYVRINTWDLKEEIEKEFKVFTWDITAFYVKFKDSSRSKYLAIPTINENFELEIKYEKQT